MHLHLLQPLGNIPPLFDREVPLRSSSRFLDYDIVSHPPHDVAKLGGCLEGRGSDLFFLFLGILLLEVFTGWEKNMVVLDSNLCFRRSLVPYDDLGNISGVGAVVGIWGPPRAGTGKEVDISISLGDRFRCWDRPDLGRTGHLRLGILDYKKTLYKGRR